MYICLQLVFLLPLDRLFSMRRCARCSHGISSTELVMRAREFVYHVQCFTCAHCGVQLTKGDQFGMSGHLIYCRDHYQVSTKMSCRILCYVVLCGVGMKLMV